MIALITGATSGIGRSTAELFAENGYDLIITGRRKERLDALAEGLKKKHKVKVHSLSFDVRKREEVRKNIASLPAEFKQIDVLVNNAGLASGANPIQDGDHNDWEIMIDTNVKGLLYMTKEISRLMIERKSGHIINVGSIAGKEVYPNGNVYCATKFAVDALTRATRIDLLPYGIRVSSVSPGMVETEFSIVRFHGDESKAKQVYQGFEVLKARDIAEAIWWMASRPSHVNINDLVIMSTAQANTTTLIRK